MNAIQKNEEKSVEAVGRAAKTVGKLRLDKERIRTLAGNELATLRNNTYRRPNLD